MITIAVDFDFKLNNGIIISEGDAIDNAFQKEYQRRLDEIEKLTKEVEPIERYLIKRGMVAKG